MPEKNKLAPFKKIEEIGDKTKEKIVGYVTAALALVAGLAWNDAIKTLIDVVFPLKKDGLWAKFLFAGVITVFVVVATYYLTKMFKDNKEKNS